MPAAAAPYPWLTSSTSSTDTHPVGMRAATIAATTDLTPRTAKSAR